MNTDNALGRPIDRLASTAASTAPDPMAVLVGKVVEVRKLVTQADVVSFATLTGDFHPNHVDQDYARRVGLGRNIAHGALLIGYASAASSVIGEMSPAPVVSLGYDRIRFIAPVFVDDEIVIRYEVVAFDPVKRRTTARIDFVNGHGQLVAVAIHLLQAISGPAAGNRGADHDR